MEEQHASRNEVVLVGRLAAVPEERTLPSGDAVSTWRLVLDRPPAAQRRAAARGGRPVSVDTIDCAAWTAALRRAAASWAPGDLVAVEGSLRRRFWRTPAGAASRYEVEVASAKRVAKAA
jgi:single-strand DNA-binding protein